MNERLGGWILVGILCGLLASACARYEYKEPPCPPEDIGDTTLVIQPHGRTSQDMSIEGRVVDSRSRDGMRSRVRLATRSDTLILLTDSAGLFLFPGHFEGAATIVVERIGSDSRSVGLVLTDSQTIQVTVPLRPLPLDGCPGFAMIQVRRSWWKFW